MRTDGEEWVTWLGGGLSDAVSSPAMSLESVAPSSAEHNTANSAHLGQRKVSGDDSAPRKDARSVKQPLWQNAETGILPSE